MAKRAIKALPKSEPLKLDLGCGKNKQAGFVGVDAIKFDGVDLQLNVVELLKAPVNPLKPFSTDFRPWPWASDSVDEVRCSHFLEHLTQVERSHFANELYRVLRRGATATLVTPYSGNDCAYGDPTHQWPPVGNWTYLYWNKDWRAVNGPHTEYAPHFLACDFDYTIGGSWEPWLQSRNMEYRVFAMQHYINAQRDVICTLTKK